MVEKQCKKLGLIGSDMVLGTKMSPKAAVKIANHIQFAVR